MNLASINIKRNQRVRNCHLSWIGKYSFGRLISMNLASINIKLKQRLRNLHLSIDMGVSSSDIPPKAVPYR